MKPKTKSKPKKLDEPIVDPGGWWVTGPFATIVAVNKHEHAYPQTAPIGALYGLDRLGQVWAFDPVHHRWSRVSHIRADSPHPPLPPQSPQRNRRDVECVREACGDAAANEMEENILKNGREIAPR
jgi:hypothetical protein